MPKSWKKELLTIRTLQKAASELFGTSILTGQICTIVTMADVGLASLTDVALMLFFTLTLVIYTFGPISGAHVNPAASFQFWVYGKISLPMMLVYIPCQLIGGTVGALLSYFFIPPEWEVITRNMSVLGGNTVAPNFTLFQGLVAEILITAILIFVVWGTLVKENEFKLFGGWAAGAVLGIGVYVLGPMTGESLNPARSFGPAVVMGNFKSDHWVFWAGPIVGALLGGGFYKFVFYKFDVNYDDKGEDDKEKEQETSKNETNNNSFHSLDSDVLEQKESEMMKVVTDPNLPTINNEQAKDESDKKSKVEEKKEETKEKEKKDDKETDK